MTVSRSRTRRVLGVLAALAALAGAAAAWVLLTSPVPARALADKSADAVRGANVARLAGCIACHTREGGVHLGGGAPIETPFGTFHAPNITPHPEDGIGAWSVDDLAAALTAGRSPAGSHYFPVFPYPSYTLMTDQDIVDLWAALRAVEPAAGRTPAHTVRFPFGFRPALAFWKRLFLRPGPYRPDPSRSEQWNRGAYIVNGPGHCVECHSPRNALGALDRARLLAGTTDGPEGDEVPAITVAALADEDWSAGDVVEVLRSGMLPDGDFIGGSMVDVVDHGTSHLSDEDVAAIAAFLTSDGRE